MVKPSTKRWITKQFSVVEYSILVQLLPHCICLYSVFFKFRFHGHTNKHKNPRETACRWCNSPTTHLPLSGWPNQPPRWCPLRSLLLLNRGLPGYWIWMWRTSNIWHIWPGLQPPPHETAGCSFFGTLGESWCSEHGLELITNLPYKWNIRVI